MAAPQRIVSNSDVMEFIERLVRAFNQNFDHYDGQGERFAELLTAFGQRLDALEGFVDEDSVPEHTHEDEDEGSTIPAVDDHLADASGAHAASAVSFSPAGTIAATDVQAAIEEVAGEAGGGTGTMKFAFFIA